MASELVCPEHGPYDAANGTCPYCSGGANRPAPPQPLSGDEMPTQLGGGGGAGYDEAPTELGGGGGSGFVDPTELGQGGRGIDPTEIGRSPRGGDVTELDFDLVETGLMAILWVKKGRRRGFIHQVKDGATVGRDEGDIIMDDPKVSNPHARFRLNDDDDGFVIWDFGSKNGTSVNDEKITAATALVENDVVKIGDTEMVLKVLQ